MQPTVPRSRRPAADPCGKLAESPIASDPNIELIASWQLAIRDHAPGTRGLHVHLLRHAWADLWKSAGGSEEDLRVILRYGAARAVDRASSACDAINPLADQWTPRFAVTAATDAAGDSLRLCTYSISTNNTTVCRDTIQLVGAERSHGHRDPGLSPLLGQCGSTRSGPVRATKPPARGTCRGRASRSRVEPLSRRA